MPSARSAALLVSLAFLVACGDGPAPTPPPTTAATSGTTAGATTPPTSTAPTSSTTSAPGTTPPTPSGPATTPATSSGSGTTPATPSPPAGPFVSARYGFSVGSPAWGGTQASTPWDGTGAPAAGDPAADTLLGPDSARAFAVAAPTDDALGQWVTAFHEANARDHPCPEQPQKSTEITVGGEPAIVDETHCPAQGGEFVMDVLVVHAGRGYVFFTTAPNGKETPTRHWFAGLLQLISFDV